MGLIEDLGPGPVALDTCVFVYFIEENEHYLPLVEPLFRAIDAEDIAAATSALTLLETLALPYRLGQAELARHYESILRGSRGLTMVELGLPLLRLAAELRAGTSIRTPDAVQLAAAFGFGCSSQDGALRSPADSIFGDGFPNRSSGSSR